MRLTSRIGRWVRRDNIFDRSETIRPAQMIFVVTEMLLDFYT